MRTCPGRGSGARRVLLLALTLALWPSLLLAQGRDLGFGDDSETSDAELLEGHKIDDLALLKLSHWSEVARWQGVEPYRARDDKDKEQYHWKAQPGGAERMVAGPVDDQPISTLIKVPKAGQYRVFLCYLANSTKAHPVALTLSGANQASHSYGQRLLGLTGKEQEKKLPIRFESETERIGTPSRPTLIWEFWDLDLAAGSTKFALTSAAKEARVDSLFITQSKDFRPSRSPDPESGTLNRTYYRFRISEAPGKGPYSIDEGLTYHWRHPQRGFPEGVWYWSLRGTQQTPPGWSSKLAKGEWSAWIDATDSVTNSGTWATGFLSSNAGVGAFEAQLAFVPHEAAVIKTVVPKMAMNRGVFMIPTDSDGAHSPIAKADDAEGVWGLRPQAYLDRMETASDVHRRHLQWGKDGLAGVYQDPEFKGLKHLLPYTGCGASPAAMEPVVEMFQTLGVPWLLGVPQALREKYQLHSGEMVAYNDALFAAESDCGLDPRIDERLRGVFADRAKHEQRNSPDFPQRVELLKMGDEIGAIAGGGHIELCTDCRMAFHDYLRQQLKGQQAGPEFLGVADVEQLSFLEELPAAPSKFERRLYYLSQRFQFVLTARFYERMTKAAQTAFPNVRSYCNFSPHPTMFGGSMNGSDWFELTRLGGANCAWAEDWSGVGGSWSFAGIQTVSYYAAMVECAARDMNIPAGFYVVCGMSGVPEKLFCLLPRGIKYPMLYSWGPMYAGAEGSNFWSESPGVYKRIAVAMRAIGRAEPIIALGAREKRNVAVLYNRTHEIYQGGEGGSQSDRLLTFIGLLHAHVPVELILNEDLTAEKLARYQVLYIQGFNLPRAALPALEQWVKAGGTLVGTAGSAMRDEFDEDQPATTALFGASQRVVGTSRGSWHPLALPEHQEIDQLHLSESDLTPKLDAGVIGVKAVLTPTTGKSVGSYDDGSCAAVVQELGKGRTLLLGVLPGLLYKGKTAGSNQYTLERLDLVAKPARKFATPSRVTYSEPRSEICLFEDQSAIAVTILDASYQPDKKQTLTLTTDRPIQEVFSTTRGKLAFQKDGNKIVVELTTAPNWVDALIFK